MAVWIEMGFFGRCALLPSNKQKSPESLGSMVKAADLTKVEVKGHLRPSSKKILTQTNKAAGVCVHL